MPDDVADRPQPVAGAHPLVDLDACVRTGRARRSSRPRSSRFGVRPAATSTFSNVSSWPSTATRELPVVVRDPRDRDAGRAPGCPRARTRPRPGAPASGSTGPRMRSADLDHRHPYAEAGQGLGQLGADRSAADDDQRAGQGVDPQHVAVGPERRVRQPVDRRRRRAGAGVEHDARWPPRTSRRPPRRCAGRRAGRARARTGTPASSSRLTATVSSQSSVASSRIRAWTGRPVGPHVGRSGEPVDAGGPRRAAFAARITILLGMQPKYGHSPPTSRSSTPDHREPGLRQLRRRRLAARTETDHHHVTAVRRHGASQAVSARWWSRAR